MTTKAAARPDRATDELLLAVPELELPEGQSVAGLLSPERREFACYSSDPGPDGVLRSLIAELGPGGEIILTELASEAPRRALWRRRGRRTASRIVARPADPEEAYRAAVAVISSWLRRGHCLDVPSTPTGSRQFLERARRAGLTLPGRAGGR